MSSELNFLSSVAHRVSTNPEGLVLVDFETREQTENAVEALNNRPNLNSTNNLELTFVEHTNTDSSEEHDADPEEI